MAYLLGDNLSISSIHGQPKRNSKGQVVIPMYHPAAALYRGDLRPVLKADFAKIPKVLELIDKGDVVTEEEHTKEAKEADETHERQEHHELGVVDHRPERETHRLERDQRDRTCNGPPMWDHVS